MKNEILKELLKEVTRELTESYNKEKAKWMATYGEEKVDIVSFDEWFKHRVENRLRMNKKGNR